LISAAIGVMLMTSRVEFLVDHERGGEGMSVNDWSSTDIAKEEPEI
jgi:hypothetical protein